MGQRHQAYLIARLRPSNGPPRYRCIGCFHHQWCYGWLLLQALSRFLDLLRQPENAAVVRGELRDLDGKYEDLETLPTTPCPYTVSLLGIAWTTDLAWRDDPGYISGVTLKQALFNGSQGYCWHIDNDEGITVIDITDVSLPGYCIVLSPNAAPRSAYEYLHCYAPSEFPSASDSGPSAHNGEIRGSALVPSMKIFYCLSYFVGLPIISADVLEEAFQRESFRRRKEQMDEVLIPRDRALSHLFVRFAEELRDRGLDHEDPAGIEVLVKRVFVGLDTTGRLEAFHNSVDPDFARIWSYLSGILGSAQLYNFVCKPVGPDAVSEAAPELQSSLVGAHVVTEMDDDSNFFAKWSPQEIRNVLRRLSPVPDGAVEILSTRLPQFGAGPLLDLSGVDMSIEQITRLLAAHPGIRALDLSDNSRITTEDIPELLNASPGLSRLIIMGCQSLNGDDLLDLMRKQPMMFRQLEGLQHPQLLAIAPKPNNFPISFTLVFVDERLNGVSIPLFTPTLVLQAIARIVPIAWREYDLSMDHDRGYDILEDGTFSLRTPMFGGDSTFLSAAMLGYTAFTSSGDFCDNAADWYMRPVVSVPLHPHAVVLHHPSGSWAFLLQWPLMLRGEAERRSYAFVHYRPLDDWEAGGGSSLRDRTGCSEVLSRGKAYDLYGFLRCMADEGRPIPSTEVVERVATLLYERHKPDGKLICPIMDDHDLPAMSSVVPDWGLYSPSPIPGVSQEDLCRKWVASMLRTMGGLPPDEWESFLARGDGR